ncbi:hypothetical protein NNC19_21755 [Clostridium sp. SHJSY1]|uniref:hypothetical protein n=1 Tax=Clostridium sp. SHJSY1 TaxID=2942483 RepID=UPI00287575C9|nr:hypothetical protein [Clostridium sp. SHJSY1]MDS0528316.1 hypothetical protein [Clostridium sp. SHJSY1]
MNNDVKIQYKANPIYEEVNKSISMAQKSSSSKEKSLDNKINVFKDKSNSRDE